MSIVQKTKLKIRVVITESKGVLICFARNKKGAWIASRTVDGVGSVFGTAVVSILELLMNVMWAADLNRSWAENMPNFGLKLIQ
ncbi:hypothetical protein H5410_037393 [Solanum commersonii]|uniref:Uncharacterized protein n=1 Tax=Solanum commersonii TaxID=4109 RepID=A0A9J5Y709_SOLCO|nr:hypothetical protein H5410_037393 [Solanum commersonii]